MALGFYSCAEADTVVLASQASEISQNVCEKNESRWQSQSHQLSSGCWCAVGSDIGDELEEEE